MLVIKHLTHQLYCWWRPETGQDRQVVNPSHVLAYNIFKGVFHLILTLWAIWNQMYIIFSVVLALKSSNKRCHWVALSVFGAWPILGHKSQEISAPALSVLAIFKTKSTTNKRKCKTKWLEYPLKHNHFLKNRSTNLQQHVHFDRNIIWPALHFIINIMRKQFWLKTNVYK